MCFCVFTRVSLFALGLVINCVLCISSLLVVSTSVINCLERHVSEMTYYVLNGNLSPTHSVAHLVLHTQLPRPNLHAQKLLCGTAQEKKKMEIKGINTPVCCLTGHCQLTNVLVECITLDTNPIVLQEHWPVNV